MDDNIIKMLKRYNDFKFFLGKCIGIIVPSAHSKQVFVFL